ncbi:unnamed protein product [Urochloa decumbens]|uniref:Trehalose 6-phosphate phosphatase n=1 Tax=Urochloa decumbens TaxID=240449 RepID=A0ABC9GMD7_9POAL
MSKLLLLVTAVLLAAVQFPLAGSSDTRWNFYCAGGNLTAHSQYSTNLEAVAAELPETVATSCLLFANKTCGAVHAIAQCRGDISSPRCKQCIIRSFEDAQEVCWHQEGAFIFRDECSLGDYTKELVLSREDTSVDVIVTKVDEFPVIIHSASFDSAVVELANSVARSTTASPSRFTTGQKAVARAEFDLEIYALAQCLPSLSAEDCSSCIAGLFDMVLTQNMTAGRAAKVWRSFQYAPEKFFIGEPMLDLPVNGSLPPTKPVEDKHRHRQHISVLVWIAIAVGLVVLLAIIIIWAGVLVRDTIERILAADERGSPAESAADERGSPVERGKGKPLVVGCLSALTFFEDIINLARARRIAVLLDYDGTLTPVVNTSDNAFMSEEMRATVRKLAALFATSIVSERSCTKVMDFVQITEINYAGSLGLEIMTTATVGSSTEIVREFLVRAMDGIIGATIEDNKYSVSVHYRNVADEDKLRVEEVVNNARNEHSLTLTQGHMVYELSPPNWNKGHAVNYLLKTLSLDNPENTFSVYIGDNNTDEDAFKVLQEQQRGVGILVAERSKPTAALYYVKNPMEVKVFLQKLIEWAER